MTTERLLSNQSLTLEEVLTIGKCDLRYLATGNEVCDLLIANGYTHLGWLNSGISAPSYPTKQVYANDSGSYCISVSEEHKTFYCVDMGD